MSAPPCLKKPKLETDTVDEVIDMDNENDNGELNNNNNNNSMSDREEQEEALIALIEHRTKEVEHLRKRVSYYFSQLEQSEKRLKDSESRLARLRRGDNAVSSKNALENGTKKVKVESGSNSFNENIDESSSKSQRQSRTELLIPALKPKISQPLKLTEPGMKGSTASGGRSVPSHSNNITKLKGDKFQREQEAVESQDKGAKRKFEEKEHQELIPSIRSRSSPCLIRCHSSSHISSQHKRKLRSLAICPVNDQLFVTSALDGVVNLWQIQGRGSGASLLSSADCLSPKQRRWPEDLAWHPQGNSVVFTYTADDGDSQISVMNLNKTEERTRVTFLEDKPHVKGIINNINFLPSHTTCFVTGGSDHAVILWNEKDGGCSWKPKALHRNLHSSSVMGVAGMQQKQVVISVGADKRIVGFDLLAERTEFKHQVESKCMSVLPNPCDFNLYMVQTATPERQLKLFDVRLRQTEIHAFGWKQESSESQSALINQAWSPDGYYISSGSADPIIHIFDIRYNVHKPSQSVKAHQKRVFKAVWHFSLPLLISISSDLNIGLHKIS